MILNIEDDVNLFLENNKLKTEFDFVVDKIIEFLIQSR